MESLALVAALVVLGIVALGIVGVATIARPPRSAFGRVLLTVLLLAGVIAGGWFAALDLAIGARLVGATTATACLAGLVRSWRRRR